MEKDRPRAAKDGWDVSGLLKAADIRPTEHRIKLLDYLLEMERPLSHAEIDAKFPDMDRVTIYRTLSLFVERGLAHQVQGPDGVWRFCAHSAEGGSCPGDHPHFLCRSCGRMFCLPDERMPKVSVPDGYAVAGKQFVVYGTCGECLRKNGR